jgi:plastocyanin
MHNLFRLRSESERLIVVASVAALTLGLSSPVPGPRAAAEAAKPRTHTVVIEATSFQPAALAIKPGDTVVWVNRDPFPHTATSKSSAFDSQAIAEGKTWSYTFKKKGAFPYVCTLHPTMEGSISVK